MQQVPFDPFYIPIVPCSNKYLQQVWDIHHQHNHVERIRTMKAAVDNRLHIERKVDAKKTKAVKERQDKIAKENKLLLDKLQRIACIPTRDKKKQSERTNPFHEMRQKEAGRIQQENAIIVKRLDYMTKAKSVYSRDELLQDYEKSEATAKRISAHSNVYHRPVSAKTEKETKKSVSSEILISKRPMTAGPRRDYVKTKYIL